MIAVLRYKEGIFTNDGSIVFRVLAKHGVEIIKTTTFLCRENPKVKIEISSQEKLKDIVAEINRKSCYTVSVVKIEDYLYEKKIVFIFIIAFFAITILSKVF